ncbi:putative transcriptional regulator [Lachnospiraceae bacterium PFB1-21]
MLIKLLTLLEEGRAYSQLELAESLGTGEEGVKAQVEYLERMGLLRRVERGGGCDSCGGKCGNSSCDCQNVAPRGPVMWERV